MQTIYYKENYGGIAMATKLTLLFIIMSLCTSIYAENKQNNYEGLPCNCNKQKPLSREGIVLSFGTGTSLSFIQFSSEKNMWGPDFPLFDFKMGYGITPHLTIFVNVDWVDAEVNNTTPHLSQFSSHDSFSSSLMGIGGRWYFLHKSVTPFVGISTGMSTFELESTVKNNSDKELYSIEGDGVAVKISGGIAYKYGELSLFGRYLFASPDKTDDYYFEESKEVDMHMFSIGVLLQATLY